MATTLTRKTPLARRSRTGRGNTGPQGGAVDEQRKQAARERLLMLTRLMDGMIDVPALRTKVGLDALLGLVPVAGDLISGLIGLYLIREARELGASKALQLRMLGNLGIDFAVGAVPILGDAFDVYFKAHVRNLRLLQKELGEPYIDGDIRGADHR